MTDDFDIEELFDETSKQAWFVELCFRRPSALSDDEMELFFSDRDGRWSTQTKNAIKKFNAKGVDLNQNWALVEQNWRCPGCRRYKSEIFRLSRRGILLAKIEGHHDHLRDYVGKRARELFGDLWLAEARSGSGTKIDILEELVSSFRPELVCSECNTADGKAKIILNGKIPQYFSFSPLEISQFIIASANSDHQISEKKLSETWNCCEKSLFERVSYIDQSLRMIKSGTLYFDRGNSAFRVTQRQFEAPYQLYKAFLSQANGDERSRELTRMIDEFLARSVQKASPMIAPKPKPLVSSVSIPTDAEYRAFCDPNSPRKWRETPDEWKCPICYSSKFQTLRKSKSKKWTSGIRDFYVLEEEKDEFNRHARRTLLKGFSHEFIMRGFTTINVCLDCADVQKELKLRRQDITEIYLTYDDIKLSITSIDSHIAHSIDFEIATIRALSSRVFSSAWDAYHKHKGMVSRLASHFEISKRLLGLKKAKEALINDIMFEADIDDTGEAERLADWILAEAAISKLEDKRNRAAYLARKASQNSH